MYFILDTIYQRKSIIFGLKCTQKHFDMKELQLLVSTLVNIFFTLHPSVSLFDFDLWCWCVFSIVFGDWNLCSGETLTGLGSKGPWYWWKRVKNRFGFLYTPAEVLYRFLFFSFSLSQLLNFSLSLFLFFFLNFSLSLFLSFFLSHFLSVSLSLFFLSQFLSLSLSLFFLSQHLSVSLSLFFLSEINHGFDWARDVFLSGGSTNHLLCKFWQTTKI